jgi:hypothetical protein
MIERTGEFNAQILAFLTGDSPHLDVAPEPRGEMEDTVQTPEGPLPFAPSGPSSPEPDVVDPEDLPTVARKQDGRYPSRDRDPRESEDRPDATDPSIDQHLEGYSPPEDDGAAERRPRRRTGNGDDPILPEIPEDLFQWPDSLKEPRPWDRPHETDREIQEERSEEAEEPEDPGKDPR